MRPLVRSVLPPSQRSAQSTFGQSRAVAKAQRLEKLSAERRKMATGQASASPDLSSVFQQRGNLLERQIGRLQKTD